MSDELGNRLEAEIELLTCFNPLTGKSDGKYCVWEGGGKCGNCELADLLKDLKAEREGLREALEDIAEPDNEVNDSGLWESSPSYSAHDAWEIAKKALEKDT
jgi:hypothetical protein